MRRRTLLVALLLVFLGWMFPAWLPNWGLASIPYYTETAAEIQKIQDEVLVPLYDSFLKQPHMWLLEHIWTVAGGYVLVSLFLILTGSKRGSGGWGSLGFLCIATLALIVWFFVGTWASIACEDIARTYGSVSPLKYGHGYWFLSWIAGLLKVLILLALALTFWVGIPIYLLCVLFLLPSALYALFRGAILLPLLLWHYLHYLFVPHPAEQIYKAGMAKHLPTSELAATVANVIYQFDLKDYDRLPKAWKSKNWEKRVNAFRGRLEAEDKFMDELIKNLRLKAQFREQG